MGAKRNFVILSSSGSGQSELTQVLRACGIEALDDLLHDDLSIRSKTAAICGEQPRSENQDGANYVRRFFETSRKGRGFSLLYEHARLEPASTAWDFLVNHPEQICVIHLVRYDLLACWLSSNLALRRDRLAGIEPKEALHIPPFSIDPIELSSYFDRVISRREWVRRAFQHHAFLEVRNEEAHHRLSVTMISRILRHLECDVDLDISFPEKLSNLQQDLQLERQIANFEELRIFFQNTPHEAYFQCLQSARHKREHPGFCTKPFEFLGIDAAGKIRVCCEDWLPTPIGDVRSGSLQEQWNSTTAMAIRESIIDGSYRFCNASHCPKLVKGTLPGIEMLLGESRRLIDEGRTTLQSLPQTLSLGYDPTCNLRCPTCRSDFMVLQGSAFERAAVTQDTVISELLPTARTVIITGHGDAIASRLHRQFLRQLDATQFPKLRIILMTNGLLLDLSMWESFRSAHPAISGVSISIDAATPATYALNRGGDFEKLMRNLEFLGELKRRGEIEFLETSFVVQANNFREMPDFVQLGHRLGCSSILFMKLIHWPGTFSEDSFRLRAVHEVAHPLHEEFVEILQSPLFRSPDIDLSNLAV